MSEYLKVCFMPVASCSLDPFAHPDDFFQSFQETFILACYHCFILPTWACHHLGLRQSHSALTLPSDDAYASAAPDANKAKLFQALSSVISNVLLLQACCQARLPSRTHSPPFCIWPSRLSLTTPARPSTTAMPNIRSFMRKNSR